MKFQKFVPLAKMEEQSDGTLYVFGTVTAELPDLEKEVCDYPTTAEYYKLRANERLALTSKVEGQTPSMMAMRGMHQLEAEGAGRAMVFDDAAKVIKMGFHVVDSDAVKKWRAGVYIGFSQGGSYVKRWPDPQFEGCTRYTADPIEVSAVDAPCLPVALLESMKGRTVSLMKSAGAVDEIPLVIPSAGEARLIKAEREISELRQMLKAAKTKRVDGADLTADCFAHVGDADDTATWLVPIHDEAAVKAALAGFEKTAGVPESGKKQARAKIMAAASGVGIEVADADKAAAASACAKISLRKGLYEVGWLGDLLESLNWLCLQTEFERDMEEDGSRVPERLREAWMALLAEFKAMAIEEADELAASAGRGEKGMKITDQAGLTKAAKTIADHLEKHMEMHKALHEKMEGTLSKEHPIMKAHDAMMTHCEKCMKAAKDAGAGEEPEEADKTAPVAADAIAKAVTEALKPVTDEIAALKAKMATTPANPPAHTGAGTVGKSVTIDADFAELLK